MFSYLVVSAVYFSQVLLFITMAMILSYIVIFAARNTF
jgi:hypothetical protein